MSAKWIDPNNIVGSGAVARGVQAFDWCAKTLTNVSVKLDRMARDIQTWNPYIK